MIPNLSSMTLCLALAIYHEARGEPLIAQKAVASVILERSKNKDFPDNICGVIYQKGAFSGIRKVKIKEDKTFRKIYALSKGIINGREGLPIKGRLYFNATRLGKIRNTKHTKQKIGKHYFY